MNEGLNEKPPLWFMIVSGLALVWNLLGVGAYLQQVTMSPEAFAKLPAADQAVLGALPSWYMAAFAIAVFAGAVGSLGLLLKKRWATKVLVLSLLAVVLQQIYFWVLTDIGSKQPNGQLAMTISIPVVAVLLVMLGRSAVAKGWLR